MYLFEYSKILTAIVASMKLALYSLASVNYSLLSL